LSIRAYAEHRRRHGLLGHTSWAVQKAIKTGRIRKNAAGKIDPVQADRDWEGRTSPARRTRPSESTFAGTAAAGLTGVEYAQARAARELYEARLARLDYEERSGKLVSADKVKTGTFQKTRQTRDRLMMIPRRLAAQLAVETDPRAVEQLLADEIRKAMETLGDG
jgi:hypothetical protein